jgi:hypothetical protein
VKRMEKPPVVLCGANTRRDGAGANRFGLMLAIECGDGMVTA